MSKMSNIDIMVQEYEACKGDRDRAYEEAAQAQQCMAELEKEIRGEGYLGELKSTAS